MRYLPAAVLVILSLIVSPFIVHSASPFVANSNEVVQKVAERYHTPFDVTKVAFADARAVAKTADPEVEVEYIRYLDLRCVPREHRMKLKRALDKLLNSLNTKYRDIIRTAVLPSEQDPVVIRVNLNDFGISKEAWDFLAENGSGPNGLPDPFYHVFLEEVTNGKDTTEEYEEEVKRTGTRRGTNGQLYETEWTEKVKRTRTVPGKSTKKKTYATAPWLAMEPNQNDRGKTIAGLVDITQTKNPILNGQWFLYYAGIPPAYWLFIGLKGKIEKNDVTKVFTIKDGEKEFEDLVKFDRVRAKQSQVGAISDSKIVTLHNRILIRKPTVNGLVVGYYWASFDTDSGIDDQDYLNNIANFDNPKIVAKEIIATAVNTLQVYAVADANGNLVSEAATKVAIHGDSMPTKIKDKVIYSGIRSCALCHNEGIIPIDDNVRDLASDSIALLITDKLKKENKEKDRELAKRIKDAFKPNLKEIVKFDVSIHTAAIKACNDWSPNEDREAYEDFVVDYYDVSVTLEKAALEAGWPVDALELALKRAVGVDYTVTALISKKVKPSRLPWERQGYAAMMNYLLSQPQPVK